jgi:thymidine kinase
MSLEVIIGCMFSGKSTEMIHRIRMYRVIDKRVCVINHCIDTRYATDGGFVVSHNHEKEAALSLSALHDCKATDVYTSSEVILIEEGQFFGDLYDFVRHAVEVDNKHVIVAGLDGDYRREPFGDLLRLIPLADKVTRLHALCAVCRDGTQAHFTKRLNGIQHQTWVGAIEDYIPVCRKHYLL